MKDEERTLLLGVARALLEMQGPPSYYVHQAFKLCTLFPEPGTVDEGWTDGHEELRKLIEKVESF